MTHKIINIGGREFNVRPFNIKGLRLLMPKLDSLAEISTSGLLSQEQLTDLVDIIVAALRGNEGITREWLEENLEVTQLNDVFDVILQASGFRRAPLGEGAAPLSH